MRLAVIPARGGSKRIPGKNIRNFSGKPIIAYSIEAALASGLFDQVIVSTDDSKIKQSAMQYGASVPFMRPASISDDHTGTNAVVRHAIKWFVEQGEQVSQVCCIYATAPFIQIESLKAGYELLLQREKSFAFSVTSFPFPVQRALRINTQNELEAMSPEMRQVRSQDLEEAYHDAGQFYWGTAEAFLQEHELFSTCSVPVVIPRHLVQDIDTEEDWVRAELMYKALSGDR